LIVLPITLLWMVAGIWVIAASDIHIRYAWLVQLLWLPFFINVLALFGVLRSRQLDVKLGLCV
jgi:hypothetical protein